MSRFILASLVFLVSFGVLVSLGYALLDAVRRVWR